MTNTPFTAQGHREGGFGRDLPVMRREITLPPAQTPEEEARREELRCFREGSPAGFRRRNRACGGGHQ